MQEEQKNPASTDDPQGEKIDNYEKYLLQGRGAIIQKLRQLEKSKSMITAHFGGGKYSMLTAVVDVMPDRDLLVLDYGANETLNKKILEAKRIIFKTRHQGITAQFTADRLQRAKRQGKTAFACALPDSLLWVQRREFYRIRVPMSEHLNVEFVDRNNQPVSYEILDLSIGGLCIHRTDNRIAFEEEQLFINTKINLSPTQSGYVNLQVRNIIPVKADDPSAGVRVGCQFIDLSMEMSGHIQRYIHTIEALTRHLEK